MLETIQQTIQKYKMIAHGDRVVCGVSGGPDSMALLHALLALRKDFSHSILVAHLDHGLRDEAEAEAEFVHDYCYAHDVPFFMEKADIASMANEEHISLEDAGRRARYSLFNRVLEGQHANRIAVGHQMQDNAETVIWNLMRGSGLNGLCGIRPVQGNIIRPLLFASREQIMEYIEMNQIPYVNDSSNKTCEYTRNRIRHTLLPEMQRYNPNIHGTLSRMAQTLSDDEQVLEEITESYYNKAVASNDVDGLHIDLDTLKNAPKAVARRMVRKAVGSICGLKDLTSVQVESVLELMKLQAGSCADIHGGLAARRGFDTIEITKQGINETREETPETPLNLEGETDAAGFNCKFTCTRMDGIPADLREHPEHYQYFDADLFPQDAVVRSRRDGDKIKPLGCGHMKLKKYLSQKKIPRWNREDIPVIACGQNILWAVGYGISDEVKVGEDTTKILRITCI